MDQPLNSRTIDLLIKWKSSNKPCLGRIPGGNVSTLTARPYEPGKPWLSRIRNVPGGFVLSELIASLIIN